MNLSIEKEHQISSNFLKEFIKIRKKNNIFPSSNNCDNFLSLTSEFIIFITDQTKTTSFQLLLLEENTERF